MNTKSVDQKKDLLRAKDAVFRLLKYRLRSEKEIRVKLQQKNFSQSIIDNVVEYFKRLDLINDKIFAEKWTTYRLAKPYGINRIRFELKQKGIDQTLIESTLNQHCDNDHQAMVALELASRRKEKYKNIDPKKIKQRLYAYLARRGFNTSIIYKAINQL